MRRIRMFDVLVVFAVVGGVALGSLAFGARPRPRPIPGPIGTCPNSGIYCLDVWDPVTCDNGVTYSNQCYADRACATGCVEGYPSQ